MKCKSCGSILSYDDKYCKCCGSPPEQDYEHNKDRVITGLPGAIKNGFSELFSGAEENSRNQQSNKFCSGCGSSMRLVNGETFDNKTGARKQYYECPEKTKIKENYRHKLFGAGYKERVEFLKHDSDVPFNEFRHWNDFS